MKLTRSRKKDQPETIVTMIDLVFFLLVFFMLVGRMDATAPFDVLPPTAQIGADMPAGGLTLAIASDGRMALDGVEITETALPGHVARYLGQDPRGPIRVNAHKDADLRHVLPRLAALEALGAAHVFFVVTTELK